MKNTTKSSSVPSLVMGLDIGDRYCRYAILDRETGAVVEQDKVATNADVLRLVFARYGRMRIALEVGTHSPWVSRVFAELGHEVIVANPRKLRLIYQSNKKNDKADALSLAKLARLDPELLSPVHHRGGLAQAHLVVIRSRDVLVRARTKLINHVRGAVKSYGKRVPSCSAPSFHRHAARFIPKDLWDALSPLLDEIGSLTEKVRRMERTIEKLATKTYPESQALSQVPGIGPLTATAYVLTIDDPKRFKNSRQVGSYFGLRPRQDESGDSRRQLRITKAGDGFLRRLLVGSAQYILGPFGRDNDLRRWGLELAARGGRNAKKRAVVAVARKLAVLLHRLWITGAKYEPLRNRGPEVATATSS